MKKALTDDSFGLTQIFSSSAVPPIFKADEGTPFLGKKFKSKSPFINAKSVLSSVLLRQAPDYGSVNADP